MVEIKYIKGDATEPVSDGPKILVHVCNDIGGWGKGFVLAISRRWPGPEREYRKWAKEGTDFELGKVQFVRVKPDLWVANLIGQHKIRRQKGQAPPIRYEAIREGLIRVAEKAVELEASIHMPRIGCGLAGGKWDRIEPMIQETLLELGVSVTVYDFEDPPKKKTQKKRGNPNNGGGEKNGHPKTAKAGPRRNPAFASFYRD